MILKLNKEIYPEKALKRAIKFYGKVADFRLKEQKDYFLVSGYLEKEDAELVKNEFLNFVLEVIRQ